MFHTVRSPIAETALALAQGKRKRVLATLLFTEGQHAPKSAKSTLSETFNSKSSLNSNKKNRLSVEAFKLRSETPNCRSDGFESFKGESEEASKTSKARTRRGFERLRR